MTARKLPALPAPPAKRLIIETALPRWPFVLALIVAGLAILTGCAVTPEQLRGAFHAVNGADAVTTIARDRDCMIEKLPLLGSDPPPARVAGLAVAKSGAYEIGYRALADAPERLRKVYGWIAVGAALVGPVSNVKTLAGGCPQ